MCIPNDNILFITYKHPLDSVSILIVLRSPIIVISIFTHTTTTLGLSTNTVIFIDTKQIHTYT